MNQIIISGTKKDGEKTERNQKTKLFEEKENPKFDFNSDSNETITLTGHKVISLSWLFQKVLRQKQIPRAEESHGQPFEPP